MLTITKRMTEVFRRAIVASYAKIQKHFHRVDEGEDDESETHTVIRLDGVELGYLFDGDLAGQDFVRGTVQTHFIIEWKRLTIMMLYAPDKMTLLTAIEKLEGQTFAVCEDCEQAFAEEDGYCVRCYAHRTSQTEDCPICLDDAEAVWVKTKCGHVFHQKCWNRVEMKIGKRSCPLCRTESFGVDKV